MFTKQHYQAIAETISKTRISLDSKMLVVIQFCIMLDHDNARFDEVKFKEACYGRTRVNTNSQQA